MQTNEPTPTPKKEKNKNTQRMNEWFQDIASLAHADDHFLFHFR